MKYAIVEDGKVVNLAVSEEPLAENWIASDTAGIGDLYQVGEFIKVDAAPEKGNYREQRAAEYPPMADYLDGIVKGDQAHEQA